MSDTLSIMPETIVSLNEQFETLGLDDEKVTIDFISSKYYGFNSVGSRILELAACNISVQAIISQLLIEYKTDEKTCTEAVLSFLNTLRDKNIIKICTTDHINHWRKL